MLARATLYCVIWFMVRLEVVKLCCNAGNGRLEVLVGLVVENIFVVMCETLNSSERDCI